MFERCKWCFGFGIAWECCFRARVLCRHCFFYELCFPTWKHWSRAEVLWGQPQLGALRPHALADINVLLLVMLHASYYESSTSRFVFHIMLHVLLHVGLMFHPSNQDVLEECRFKLLIKTCRWNQTHDKETTDVIICVAKNIFVSFAINPCFLSPCLPARFCELSNESNTQVDNELNTQVDNELNI